MQKSCVADRSVISYIDLYHPADLENVESCIHLNDGRSIPIVGLATCAGEDKVIEAAVKYAVEAGYRHLDCAWFHGNERAVGAAVQELVKRGVIPRQQLFITTKLWNNFHSKKKVLPMLKESLAALKVNYVDLYLIQWPFGFNEKSELWPDNAGPEAYSDVDYTETWEGMEECVRAGLAKGIGVCNFNAEQLTRLMDGCKIRPAVNQIEINPNLNQAKLIRFCREAEITVIGYHPFGKLSGLHHTGFPPSSLFDERIIDIGRKYNKTAAQVILRFLVNQGVCFVVRALEKKKILENISIFDFNLEEEDSTYLHSLNKDARTECPTEFKNHMYYPFNAEF